MRRGQPQDLGNERGYALVELLVAIVIFVLILLTIDAVFATVNRSSRTVEVAADVQQSGRVAIERLSREIRFSKASEIRLGPADSRWVAFKSARLSTKDSTKDPRVFCVYANKDDKWLYNADCNPPQEGPDAFSYRPYWQGWIVYWLDPLAPGTVCTASSHVLRRTVQPLSPPPGEPTGLAGDIVAANLSDFRVELDPGNQILTVTLDLAATAVAQGSNIPTQCMTVNGRIVIQN